MTPSEQRLYEELSAMTGATRIEPSDPGTERCMSALTGETAATLDDYIACYGEDDDDAEVTDDEQRLYEELSEMTGVPTRPTEARTVDVERRVIVPRSLIETINRSYAEIARAGFLADRDFEEKLHAWLAESSGA